MIIAKQPHFSSNKTISRPWLLIWISIFTLITIIGISSPDSYFLTFIKLGGIILCLIYAIMIFPNDNLLHLALFVTIAADIILAIDNTSEFGVVLFLCTQIIHTVRLSHREFKPYILAFVTIAAICIIATAIFHFAPLIYTISTFYVINLIVNIILCWNWSTNNPTNLQAKFGLAGFLLFLCCDICTGASYLSFNSALPYFLYLPANFFAWFFYYPSQVLISLSSKSSSQATRPKD